MRRWWVRLVRKIMKLPPLAEGPPPVPADQIVYRGGYRPAPGKLGSPPTGGSAVIRDRTYSDPVADAVVMGIILHGALNHDVQSVSDAG